MEKITIDSSIFPVTMYTSLIRVDGTKTESIALPCEANILYLKSIRDPNELMLLKKFANKDTFSDKDYEMLLKLFINNIPKKRPSKGDFTELCGVCHKEVDGIIQFALIDEYIPYIKADTWECITIALLKECYTDIINCFDFGDIEINLGSWTSCIDVKKQSLLSTLRSALMYTLVEYLYGNDINLYSNFNDFFENEFYKRVSFVYATWKQCKDNELVRYIPIYDSFYNFEGNSSAELKQIIGSILQDENIVNSDKIMIKDRLVKGAIDVHNNRDPQSILLEKSIIKPVVNYLFELQEAFENIDAAELLKDMRSASVNRSYYAMMHALKALLEHENQLADWEPNKLNVKENHKALEIKLTKLSLRGIIGSNFVSDFQYVKYKRWDADYNLSIISEAECVDCINRAKNFVEEVKRLSK